MSLRSVRALLVAAALAPLAGIAAAQQPAPPPGPGGPPGQQPQAPLPPNGWRIDMGHSAIRFRVRHMGVSWVNGQFKSWTGELVYDPAHPEAASVTAHIQTASIASENDRRDNDARSGNYLAVDSFPEMAFISRQVQVVDSTHLRVIGDLTLRGVTRSVTLDTEILGQLATARGRRIGFTATTMIKRQDYNIVFGRLTEGAQVVGDNILITIDIEATRPNAS